MGSQQNNINPVFQLCISGSDVMVRFSEEESVDVKCKVRDILTGAYRERLQRTPLLCGDDCDVCVVMVKDTENGISANSTVPYNSKCGGGA